MGVRLHTKEKFHLNKKIPLIGLYPKGQFFKNTAYLERGMQYFAFVTTNAVLVRKIDKS